MRILTFVMIGAMVGWLFFDKDPNQLVGILGTLGVSTVGLEAGNVGKRATFKKEAVEAGV
jgi:hypothetical protein